MINLWQGWSKEECVVGRVKVSIFVLAARFCDACGPRRDSSADPKLPKCELDHLTGKAESLFVLRRRRGHLRSLLEGVQDAHD
ncbi:hypothetical protein MPLSOD_340056 [Mesorhizobium sp. SOD10]|nr:hypothetical protein MPLSOD_340056 [Mesorhizobium sp. SOD10]